MYNLSPLARLRRAAGLRYFLLLLAGSFLLQTPTALAGSRAVNLAEMTASAARVVHGRVVEVHTGNHPNYPRVSVTFVKVEVIEMLKGGTSREVTFMQYGGEPGQGALIHLPQYRVGEEVMLFLYPESRYGLTSPVGEGQGKFVVRDDLRSGQRTLVNAHGNRALFGRLSAGKLRSKLALSRAEQGVVEQSEGSSAGVELSAFRSLVRKLAANPHADLSAQ